MEHKRYRSTLGRTPVRTLRKLIGSVLTEEENRGPDGRRKARANIVVTLDDRQRTMNFR
jgi:hypothetical protein